MMSQACSAGLHYSSNSQAQAFGQQRIRASPATALALLCSQLTRAEPITQQL